MTSPIYIYRLVHGFLKFKSKLDRKAVAQDKAKTEPLCMAQYFRVLTTYRYRLTVNIFTASVNIFPPERLGWRWTSS